jgi:hypothetical protein
MPYKDAEVKKLKAKEVSAKWYQNNKDITRERTRKHHQSYRHEKRDRVRVIKETNPCSDCRGKFHFSAMDFDHVTGEKLGDVGTLVSKNANWDKIQEEIAKCELVCANCHRIRSWNRMQVEES